MNRSNGSTSCSVLALVRAILFIVCGVALIAAIIDARDLDQAGSTFSEQGRQQTGRLSVEGPTPTPLPCPLCWQQLSFSENFDGFTPPALPPDWLATNAQGPPRFGCRLILEFQCRPPTHCQMPHSLTILL